MLQQATTSKKVKAPHWARNRAARTGMEKKREVEVVEGRAAARRDHTHRPARMREVRPAVAS